MGSTPVYLCRACGAELSLDESSDLFFCDSCDFEMDRDEYLERFG